MDSKKLKALSQMTEKGYCKHSCKITVHDEARFDDDIPVGYAWYSWTTEKKQFPQDIEAIFVCLPQYTDDNGKLHGMVSRLDTQYSKIKERVKWQLSGTLEKPTLSPSVHWVGVWHGWLKDGFLKSC